MQRFRMDNTEGYTQEQLDYLSERFATWMADEDLAGLDDMARKSYEDHIAESLLALYDRQFFARQEERYGANNFYRLA
jgi:hypothetical protein